MSRIDPHNLTPRKGESLSPDQVRRLELLKLEKELQRREKEREAWQNAATPRSVFTDPEKKSSPKPDTAHRKAGKHESPFFAKLRLGRFLE